MKYEEFKKILNDKVFKQPKAELIQNLAEKPHRYTGPFRPTAPKAKIIQNLTQSNEIKFGDAFEILTEKYFIENDFEVLDKRLDIGGGEYLSIDQLVKRDKIIFIEQKMRDDHDSTKKRGQINNFEKKLLSLLKKYKKEDLQGYIYFVDIAFGKNRNFYSEEIKKMQEKYGVELYLCYGEDLFIKLGLDKVWLEIGKYLIRWKKELEDLVDINFDNNAEEIFEEIKDMQPNIYRKLFDNEPIVKDYFPVLFPEKRTLKLLKKHFDTKESIKYQRLSEQIQTIMDNDYDV